ncbi:pseudaminic acid cytidylyltransferase [Exilibacterium tricleocarpae]|uniref:Pseudaminic acid cytidylyltransferase n=1 Tax=Exilibacterium tricleocarpae TaxID=2591008 RepID=A0A545U3U3_9GAMM|nr:pseudaminic acid cytidylyltransferase [Exilibacterium tricleocarpae]TQV84147.1 pseudaminic acid cytidylyltransferase [Exilibacterium tricleocarpae]
MKVAIIPARGGSKRIAGKNIKAFCGKPIITYSIELAINSGLFDRVVVSTDCREISAVALAAGAEVPFVRPPYLSDDHCATNAVIKHAVERLEQDGVDIDIACCLYATAPLLQVEDLQRGLAMLHESGAAFAFSITSFPFPVQRAITRDANGRIRPLYPQHIYSRSQDLPEAYHDAGQFYWGTRAAYLEEMDIFSPRAVGVVVPRDRVQDIDTPEDWAMAEKLYALQHLHGQSQQTARQRAESRG